MSFLREIILTITSHKDAIGVREKKMILISNQKTLQPYFIIFLNNYIYKCGMLCDKQP